MVGAIWASVADSDLADVTVKGRAVVIVPKGLNRLWAVKSFIRVPLTAVAAARRGPDARSLPRGLRMPGTAVPGLIIAGTYRRSGHRSFWLFHRGRNAVVLETPGWTYERIVVEVADPVA